MFDECLTERGHTQRDFEPCGVIVRVSCCRRHRYYFPASSHHYSYRLASRSHYSHWQSTACVGASAVCSGPEEASHCWRWKGCNRRTGTGRRHPAALWSGRWGIDRLHMKMVENEQEGSCWSHLSWRSQCVLVLEAVRGIGMVAGLRWSMDSPWREGFVRILGGWGELGWLMMRLSGLVMVCQVELILSLYYCLGSFPQFMGVSSWEVCTLDALKESGTSSRVHR